MNEMENFGAGVFALLVGVFIGWGGLVAPIWLASRGDTINEYKQILVENNLAAYNTVGEFYLLGIKDE